MSAPPRLLIPSTPPPPLATSFPPKHNHLTQLTNTTSNSQQNLLHLSRRAAAAASLSLLFLFHTEPASAFSIGISGPKEWLREQKKKSSRFLLAPIDASRDILQTAYLLLKKEDSDYSKEDAERVQMMLTSAGRDCVPQDRSSFVAFQANTGVEVCTFRLVVNNASSLLSDKDPVKLEAEASLGDLIRSFASLNAMATQTDSSRQKVADALMDTITSLNKFEQGIKDCLEI